MMRKFAKITIMEDQSKEEKDFLLEPTEVNGKKENHRLNSDKRGETEFMSYTSGKREKEIV